jgi:basic membrane protein A and related proteins
MSRRLRAFAASPFFLAAAALAACGGETGDGGGGGGDGDVPLVYAAFATPIEEPWDGAIHDALKEEADEGNIQYEWVDNLHTADEMERGLRDIAESQQPDIIFGDAFAAEDAVREVAQDYPDIAFAFGSGGDHQEPNFSVFDNWMQDPAYLAGMLAGGLTKSDIIGVVGAMPIPEVNRIVNGFIQGVQETNPNAEVKVSFINSFFDPATAKQAAEAQIDAGADVLFAERDGVIEAAAEHQLPVIGMMVDQKEDAPQYVVTSLLWDMTPTVEAVVSAVEDDSYEATNLAEYSFMDNGGSNIAPINAETAFAIPQELIDRVEERKAEIESGEFETEVIETEPKGSTTVEGTE